jgi:transposase
MECVAMMGSNDKPQGQFFYSFDLDKVVPQDHLLCKIDHHLDLSGLREHLAPFYSHTGRPSIDPELMIRMLIIGYCLGIRYDRVLCEEVKLNLAYRWFCRLSIEDEVPHHSTFSKNRHGRFRESDALRFVFERVLQSCIDAGLVGGEGFAVDASLVKADADRLRHYEDDDDWGGGGPAIRDYLDGLNDEFEFEIKPRKRVSKTDPQARWTAAHGGRPIYAYSTNYLVDTDAGIIVDVEATQPHRTLEVNSTRTMVERVEARFALKPKRLIADTAYGNAKMLQWMVEDKAIEPHVPVWEKGERTDGTFGRSDFTYDEENNRYVCPNGKELLRYRNPGNRHRTRVSKDGTINYHASAKDCKICPYKEVCCPNTANRRLRRNVYEAARDVAREIAKTAAYRRSRDQRKQVEMLFAHMKRILKVDRLRLRGLNGARDEFLMTATAQNLRRMAIYLGTGPPVAHQKA